MKLSLFTPSHNPRWIAEAYDSLLAQRGDVPEWEWIIVLNGAAGESQLPPALRADKRARIYQAPESLPGGNIGALKRFACGRCAGDVLVEFDHDDKLFPDALATIAAALAGRDRAFLYSDAVYEDPQGRSRGGPCWGERSGWRWYPFTMPDGRAMTATAQFDPSPASLCSIYFAPDHVRAWTRAAYHAAGGHNPALAVADDHELIVKTYLAGAEFIHVKRPLYWYRYEYGGNVSIWGGTRSNEIFQNSTATKNRFLHALVLEWARRERLTLFDMGGRIGKPPGFVSVDCRPGADLTAEAVEFLSCQVRENSVGAIRCADFLEHLPPAAVVPFMNAAFRALAPGGWLLTFTPSTDGRGAFQDPTHISFWNQNSFWYYTQHDQQRFVPEITARFQAVRLFTAYPSKWHEDNRIYYTTADLCALKGQRQPAPTGFLLAMPQK